MLDRRHRRARLRAAPHARADRLRAAGDRAVPRHDPRQHRLRPPGRRDRRRDRGRGEARQRARVHRARWRRATTRSSASAATRCRAASASASASPAPSIRDKPILILDEPTAALDTESETARDGGPRAPDEGPHGDHHRAPAVAPSATPTRSSCSTTASSPSRARTTSSSPATALYAELYHVQFGDSAAIPCEVTPCHARSSYFPTTARKPILEAIAAAQEDAPPQDVRVRRAGAARRGHRGEEAAGSRCG